MTGATTARFALITLWLLALAGCGSYGGGGGGGGGAGAGSGSLAATLAWQEASGPVASYRVVLLRNQDPPVAHSDVSQPRVTIEGQEGDRVRIVVTALDAQGMPGPSSQPSPEILFTASGPVATSAAVAEENAVGSATSFAEATTEPASAAAGDETIENDAQTQVQTLADGADSLLWEAGAPSLEMRLTSLWDDALQTELSFVRPGPDWWVVARDDVDGDGHADVLWENEAGELAFSPLGALMQAAPLAPMTALGTLGDDEQLVATGDLDGDGHADLIVADEAAGTHGVWWMGVSGTLGLEDLGTGVAGSSLAASGDFDGDGRADLVWRAADGALSVHFMNGAIREASLDVAVPVLETLASGDVDGDGDDDLVVRDAEGVSVLQMGARRAASSRRLATGHEWQVAGVGDFDGDGSADLLWLSASGWLVGFEVPGAETDFLPVEPGVEWAFVDVAP